MTGNYIKKTCQLLQKTELKAKKIVIKKNYK